MSKTVNITSPQQLSDLLKASKIVVANFFAGSDAPSELVAPLYEQLSQAVSRPNLVTFVKVNAQTQKDVASAYSVTTLPTFIVFRSGSAVDKVQGANPAKLGAIVKKLVSEIDNIDSAEPSGSASGSGSNWRGAALPRGYSDITSQIEVRRSELLNVDSALGGIQVLFDGTKPSALSGGDGQAKDWIESDTDEQLMLFLPFHSMLKLHTLQITSLPPTDDDDDEAPTRPRTIKLFSNKPHNLGFDEAEDMAATQVIELTENDWNAEGTANISLRYVKFQNINSLVLFVVDGEGDSEKVRLDRIRLIGEAGEKREMGKLEKIGDEPGE
ncbi:PITH domain-containing protein [Cercophora scortea]|uniref:PITH domain-containing protein n=1 Tax=Cercophora scortea TaxID=314031 RepID=A0AAE0J2N7_9PEZI|nr:PITH domain-containing protein [Cercophora scortea]